MPESTAPRALATLRARREQIIAQLTDAFAGDQLALEEFEERLTRAHRANGPEELEPLVADLPAPQVAAAAPATRALKRVQAKQSETMRAIMGGVERTGSWTPARKIELKAIMGAIELDFREAQLGSGVTEVAVLACMGNVSIVVPPELSVEMFGSAIMGGFGHAERLSGDPDPERPLLRIHGFACMGNVLIETRLPGESRRAAHRRRRRERRALSRDQRRELPPGR